MSKITECAVLGVPIANIRMDEAVDQIFDLIDSNDHSSYVATINTHFLTNVHHWLPSKIQYQELLDIYRDAELLTADGMPLIWFSRLFGCPLPERVTGADLTLKLLKRCAENGKRIFFLGGESESVKIAIQRLRSQFPGIQIVGHSCPNIFVEGEGLALAEDQDKIILEQIAEVHPDVLMINLGNPKQELWFERVKEKLSIPVSIGIGGTLNFISGRVSRAPKWMQNGGLEWFYRIIQEPGRLFRRYLYDLVKFPVISLPLMIYHGFSALALRYIYSKGLETSEFSQNLLFLSPSKTLAMIPLPVNFGENSYNTLQQQIRNTSNHEVIILDFHQVKHMDLYGIAQLLSVLKNSSTLYVLGLSPHIRRLLQFHRVWNQVVNHVCKNPQDLINRLCENTQELYDSVQHRGNCAILTFLGRMDDKQNYADYLKKYAPMLSQNNCIIDLTYCTFIDNTGLQFLLKLRNLVLSDQCQIRLCGLSHNLESELELAKLDPLFIIDSTVESALKQL